MKYAKIDEFEVVNGKHTGVSLFVQGCHFHCNNCFNSEAWDFTGGKEWTPEIEEEFLNLIDRPYIHRVSILGGEPLSEENLQTLLLLLKKIKGIYANKEIWIYSGYTWEQIFPRIHTDELDLNRILRQEICKCCDVLVDGQYVEYLKDLSLKFRGSKNQRIIDLKKSIEYDSIILWQDK